MNHQVSIATEFGEIMQNKGHYAVQGKGKGKRGFV